MTLDIGPIVQAIVATAALVITGCAPIVTAYVIRHLGVATNSAQATRVATGVDALAQLAVSEITSVGAHNMTMQVKNAAVANALTKTSASMSAAATDLGITPATIAQRVDGAVATKLGAMPATPIPPAKEA